MSLRVAVVGGGPGGLFFASQLRKLDPASEVTVFERNQASDAFGFGVVFSDSTLNQIHEADPVLREALAEHGTHWDRIEVWLKGERRSFGGNGMAAIHRRVLLPILQDRAREHGVTMRFGESVDHAAVDRLRAQYDLVVGADGANSVVRDAVVADLGHTVDTADAKFIWFGTRYLFDGLTFVHRMSPVGAFAAHAYPISGDLSTFIVETDASTWRKAGLDRFDVTQAPGPSDEATRAFLTELFADDIQGREIVANNSRWASFRTRRSRTWHSGNVVLLGDAVHTAHFSVGSGTKMAIEDGVALAGELARGGRLLDQVFESYEAQRQPAVTRIQDSARGGLSWWERFGRYHEAFEPTQFAFHFFSRSIDIDRIESRDPELVASVRDAWRSEHGAAALETPLSVGTAQLPTRLLRWDGRALSAAEDRARLQVSSTLLDVDDTDRSDLSARLEGTDIVVIDGGSPLDRFLLSEDIRLELGTPTVVVARDGERLDPETVVLAGRADAVASQAEQSLLPDAGQRAQSDLTGLLAPRAVAVIGASLAQDKLGYAMMTSLSAFPGPVLPVNPSSSHPAAFRTVAEAASSVDGQLDLAVLCVPASVVPRSLRECAEAGVAAAVICSGGFAEIGEAGSAAQTELEAVLAETDLRVLGPNTSGFFRPAQRLLASFVPGVSALRAGSVGLVAASGGVNHAVAFQLDRTGAGVSIGVGIGAGTDVTAPDVIEHLTDDADTRCVALHIESVTDGARLLAAVRACVRRKPLVAMVVGRNDVSDFATSHTGALGTSWAATRALLAQAGAVVVDSEVELVNAASALTATRMPPGAEPGVGLVTGQAGPGLIMADELATREVPVRPLAQATVDRLGGLLPPMTYLGNPVDTGRPGETYPALLTAVSEDPGVDLMGVYGITEPVVDLPSAVDAASPAVPTVIAVDGPTEELERVRALRSEGVPVLVGPTALVHGLAALVTDARARARASAVDEGTLATVMPLGAGPWHEAAAKDVLDALGFVTPHRHVVNTRLEALEALTELSGPLAVKILDADVLHKSDIGGVHLGIRDGASMATAFDALHRIGARQVLVESMAPAGRDLILGARRDAVFGPVVVLGFGGVEAEVWADSAMCGLPASRADLARLPDQLRSRVLLEGFRGGPVLDRDALADLAAQLLAALEANPHVSEIEVNPLRLTTDGLVALDAVIIAKEKSS